MSDLVERAEKLADMLGRGHYSMSEAIAMIRELARALNVPDDITRYRPGPGGLVYEDKAGEYVLADDAAAILQAERAAKDARIKRLELDNAKLEERLSAEQESHSRTGASRDKWRERAEALESKLAAAQKAL